MGSTAEWQLVGLLSLEADGQVSAQKRTMDRWGGLPMFLAVAEGGTVRAAADALDVNLATIIHGIGRLEQQLETKLFDKPPSGCRLTDAGADLVRVPGGPCTCAGEIWLQTHAATQQTKRLRLLCDHIRTAMRGFAGRLAGRIEGYDSALR